MGKIIRILTSQTWDVYLDFFLLRKKAEGTAPRTQRDYLKCVGHFFNSFPDALSSPEELNEAVLKYFSRDMKPATFNIRRCYLKSFFTYLEKEGIIPRNPIDFPRRKDEGRAKNIPNDILKALIDAPDKTTYTGLRDYAIILFILDTGIRPGEALQLLPKDFNLDSLEVAVRAEISKTRRKRTLPLSPLTASVIRRLLTVRPREWWNEATIFCTQDGTTMGEDGLSKRFRKYSAQIGYKVTPYDLRHSFALLYLRNGGNIFTLQRTMGHADLNMTKRYLALTQEDLRAEHQKSSPINQLVEKRVRRV